MTFNIRTLNRIGQRPELTAFAIYHNIDIICIQEHRYFHSEDIKYHDTGKGWAFISTSAWKNSVNATIGGVGMLIGPRAIKSLNRENTTEDDGSYAYDYPSTTIISCYSPTYVSNETVLIAFYNQLFSLVRIIPKHNVHIIDGDRNAQIVKNVDNKFSLHNSLNRNGEHLTDFTLENRLTCLDTKFQKRKGKL